MNKGDADSGRDEVPITVEAYGIKVDIKSRPDDLGEEPPASWGDVPRKVNKHLMRIAVAPTRLVAEVLEGVTRLIRGLSRIPSSVAHKIQHAHIEADMIEGQRQQTARSLIEQKMTAVEHSTQSMGEPQGEDLAEQSINQIQSLLRKYRDKGHDAYIMFGPDGKPVIVFGVPPQSESEVLEAVEQAKKLLSESGEHER